MIICYVLVVLIDTDELRQTLSLVHWILDAKQKALQELYSEREVHSTCLYQVCRHYIPGTW